MSRVDDGYAAGGLAAGVFSDAEVGHDLKDEEQRETMANSIPRIRLPVRGIAILDERYHPLFVEIYGNDVQSESCREGLSFQTEHWTPGKSSGEGVHEEERMEERYRIESAMHVSLDLLKNGKNAGATPNASVFLGALERGIQGQDVYGCVTPSGRTILLSLDSMTQRLKVGVIDACVEKLGCALSQAYVDIELSNPFFQSGKVSAVFQDAVKHHINTAYV